MLPLPGLSRVFYAAVLHMQSIMSPVEAVIDEIGVQKSAGGVGGRAKCNTLLLIHTMMKMANELTA